MAKRKKEESILSDALIEEIFAKVDNPMELWSSKTGILAELKKRLLERALQAEMSNHLGYEKSQQSNNDNSRNGYSSKQVITDDNEKTLIRTPRDRDSTFEPQILPKHCTRWDGFNKQVIALYSRGMSVRDIQEQLSELYGVGVSTGLISNVTDAVLEDVKVWQSRPLDKAYPIVYLDGISIKVVQDKKVRNKTVYLALGLNMQGKKELLGMWIAQSESASFWLGVLNDIKNRGVEDIMIICTDGLTGFEDTIKDVYPNATHQTCIVHMIRNSCRYVPHKDRKAVCADLKGIYAADTLESAELGLSVFKEKWDKKYPSVSMIWERKWEGIIPMFRYDKTIRKVMYTTNAIESCNRSMRKVLKTKGHFTSDESVFKLMYLVLQNISKKWTMPVREWSQALNQIMILYNKE